jgi:hypothetical protein
LDCGVSATAVVGTAAAACPINRNWYSYDYTVFKNADDPTDTFLGLQSVERGNLASGVLNLTVEWKPLPHLTAEMVEWMFGNLHKKARSPFDNKIYPMYVPPMLGLRGASTSVVNSVLAYKVRTQPWHSKSANRLKLAQCAQARSCAM